MCCTSIVSGKGCWPGAATQHGVCGSVAGSSLHLSKSSRVLPGHYLLVLCVVILALCVEHRNVNQHHDAMDVSESSWGKAMYASVPACPAGIPYIHRCNEDSCSVHKQHRLSTASNLLRQQATSHVIHTRSRWILTHSSKFKADWHLVYQFHARHVHQVSKSLTSAQLSRNYPTPAYAICNHLSTLMIKNNYFVDDELKWLMIAYASVG